MKRVAITFDDGPNGEYTLQILQILKDHHIKATFFFPGKNLERQPDIAKKALEGGNLIGNHTYGHPHLNELKPYEISWQIGKSEEIFREVLGIRPAFFRAPYGELDQAAEEILKVRSYNIVDWDRECYSRDWRDISAQEIADITTARAKDGSILLLHDGRNVRESEPRDNVVEALPMVISILQGKGFEIVRLDELDRFPLPRE